MTKLLYNLKHNKWLLTLFVSSVITFILDIALIIFNIVELLITPANSASLASGFLFFNIFVIVVNVINFALIIIYLCIRKN